MNKLLDSYRCNPSIENANKLKAYNTKRPMAACLLAAVDAAILDIALRHAATGRIGSYQVHADAAAKHNIR